MAAPKSSLDQAHVLAWYQALARRNKLPDDMSGTWKAHIQSAGEALHGNIELFETEFNRLTDLDANGDDVWRALRLDRDRLEECKEQLSAIHPQNDWYSWPEQLIEAQDNLRSAQEASQGLDEATADLEVMRVIDIETGTLKLLPDTHNLADLALGGKEFAGHKLHRSQDGTTIRTTRNNNLLALVTWDGDRWKVYGVGRHEESSNKHRIDHDKSDGEYEVKVAYRRDGSAELVQ